MENWLQKAIRLHQAGNLPEALACYQRALELEPGHPDALFNTGLAYQRLGNAPEARRCYETLLHIQPTHVKALTNLGNLLAAAGETEPARQCYTRALAADPAHLPALTNLGNLCFQARELDQAAAWYRRALERHPADPGAHNNLGVVLQAQGCLAEAAPHFQAAIDLKPDYAEAISHLAHCYAKLDQPTAAKPLYAQALALYQAVLPNTPASLRLHSQIGILLQKLQRPAEASPYFLKAQQLAPDWPDIYYPLMENLAELGEYQQALPFIDQGLEVFPHDAYRIAAACIMPVIPASRAEIQQARQRCLASLDQLLGMSLRISDPLQEVDKLTFYAHYHGLNLRPLQTRLGQLYRQACPALADTAPPSRPRRAKPRIGFVSAHLRDHSIGKFFASTLLQLDQDLLDPWVFAFAEPNDAVSRQLQQRAARYTVLPRDLPSARAALVEAELDLLFYPDLGMEPITYFLAFARLAPVQCVTWGHGVTTGLPMIDYYILHQAESPQADAYYSEQPIRMEHLYPFSFLPDPPSPLKPRSAFGLADDWRIYLCPQSLFKLHPDFDALLAALLRADTGGHLILLAGHHPNWTRLLLQRLEGAIPDELFRVHIMPRLGGPDFQNLLALADVVLDPLYNSGGNTSYECFKLGVPVVTWPVGETLVGRLTAALYGAMGLRDCLAGSAGDYVDRAVRIAGDPLYRRTLSQQILERNAILFDNPAAVRELEQILLRLCHQGTA